MGNDVDDGESFVLDYSLNGGASWEAVKRWVAGSEGFAKMNKGYRPSVVMKASDYELTDDTVQM